MGKKDSGYRSPGALDEYNGYPVWDHDPGPHEINEGEVDGDIEFDPEELE